MFDIILKDSTKVGPLIKKLRKDLGSRSFSGKGALDR